MPRTGPKLGQSGCYTASFRSHFGSSNPRATMAASPRERCSAESITIVESILHDYVVESRMIKYEEDIVQAKVDSSVLIEHKKLIHGLLHVQPTAASPKVCWQTL